MPEIFQHPCLSGMVGELTKLRAHGTTSVFCSMEDNDYSWIYQPDASHDSNRIICTGNLSANNTREGFRKTCTVEFSKDIDRQSIDRQLQCMPLDLRRIAVHRTECSYPVQSKTTRNLIAGLKDTLRARNIYLVGRFAEWEYFNMDAVVASAMRIPHEICCSMRDGVIGR